MQKVAMAHPPHRAGPGTNRQGRPSGAGTTSRARQERRRDQAADQLESDVQRWWQSWYTDPNWSWAGFPCQRDNVAQRARSRDDREWTWSRETGWTLAAKHPCKRVKATEPGRAEVEAAKAKEAEAKAEDSPRNRARQLRSRRLPHRPSLLLLLHRQLPSSLQHLPLTAPVAHPRKRASRRRHRL